MFKHSPLSNPYVFGVTTIALASFISGLFIVACDPMPPDRSFKPEQHSRVTREWKDYPVGRWHDDELNVTCWSFYDNGYSCLPDIQIGRGAAPRAVIPDAGP